MARHPLAPLAAVAGAWLACAALLLTAATPSPTPLLLPPRSGAPKPASAPNMLAKWPIPIRTSPNPVRRLWVEDHAGARWHVDSALAQWTADLRSRGLRIEFAGTDACTWASVHVTRTCITVVQKPGDTTGRPGTVRAAEMNTSYTLGVMLKVGTLVLFDTPGTRKLSDDQRTAVVRHELGHALGMGHTSNPADLMCDVYGGALKPSAGELALLVKTYR